MRLRPVVAGAGLFGMALAAGLMSARPRHLPPPAPPSPAAAGVDWERELWDHAPAPTPAVSATEPGPPRAARGGDGSAGAGVRPRPRAPQQLLAIRGTVEDPAQAAQEIAAWVAARGGLAAVTKGDHVAVKIPAPMVPELLARFAFLRISGPLPQAQEAAPWVNLSLKLVAPERR